MVNRTVRVTIYVYDGKREYFNGLVKTILKVNNM